VLRADFIRIVRVTLFFCIFSAGRITCRHSAIATERRTARLPGCGALPTGFELTLVAATIAGNGVSIVASFTGIDHTVTAACKRTIGAAAIHDGIAVVRTLVAFFHRVHDIIAAKVRLPRGEGTVTTDVTA
tara:strand:- start:48 stop:440 length:393 start_codon:yes stop_codon:yes gene_type:complete